MIDVVVGCGQIGEPLAQIIEASGRIALRCDTGRGMWANTTSQIDVLHICFPYSDDFVKEVKKYIKDYKPRLTIIHSTVQVGTTRKIGGKVAYSFVRGRHQDDMTKMLEHVKHVGCADESTLDEAVSYLVEIGFTPDPYIVPEAVEYGKLMDTTYYGICIAATKMFKEHCDVLKIPWEAVAEINRAYNQGSLLVGHPEWVRPELEPVPGPIGGHCVLPNVRILKETFSHKLLDAVEEAK